MQQFLTIANVDGSGRSLLIIKHADGVLIRAGCFVGTDQEFISRARAEGKSKYVGIVSAVVAALEAENER